MATDRPATRVNLSLPDHVVAVLDRIGAASGAGRATVIREWLVQGLPMFEQMAEALEGIKAGNMDALSVFADLLQEASSTGNQASLEARHLSRTHRVPHRKRSRD